MSDENKKITDRIELRPVVMPDDDQFLQTLYFSTRYDVDLLPFDDAGKKAFMLMQYKAQKTHYDEYFRHSSHDIVLYDGEPAGRYMTDSREDEIIGVDLSLLPPYRSLGIGSTLMKGTFEEAQAANLPFVFHVRQDNFRAIKLYERLGCRILGDKDGHYKMEWRQRTDHAGE
jgi:GNAT superfamily N-acetyltransferase